MLPSTRVAVLCLIHLILAPLTGCWGKSGPEVVVYSALDREFSEPILTEFSERTGVKVLPVYDIESTKTVGLANRIIRERNNPQCDLFWNNEILHTLRLQKLGVLDVYLSPAAKDFSDDYKAADGSWHGLAARARVLIVNKRVLPDSESWPQSIEDLADPKWKGQVAIAKPLAGTTASHAAVLFSKWGDEIARDFFVRLKRNAEVLSGNKQVALAVGRGQFAFGLTDTDDAIIEIDEGQPVAIVYPDQAEGAVGTLFIPNTLCLIKDSPNANSARKLVDFLLSPDVETKLANGRSAQFPISRQVNIQSRARPDHPVRWMDVDFVAAADQWDQARAFLIQKFESAE